jgi:STE24 endopeptidase
MDSFCIFIACLIVLRCLMSLILDALNRLHMRRHSGSVPAGMEAFVDAESFRRSVAYSAEKSRFSSFQIVYDSLVLALLLFSGILPFLYGVLAGWLGQSVAAQALILVIVGQILDLPDWPLEWYGTFRIEARHGFNKSTRRLWLKDKLLGIAIGSAVFFPLACLVIYLVRLPYWWVFAATCVFFSSS